MEKSNTYAKAAYVLSLLAFLLSFFPLATAGAVYARHPDFYTVLMIGICSYFPTAIFAFVCDILAGDHSETQLADRSGFRAILLAYLSSGMAGARRVRVTMKSPASAWLARSGIALVVQMVLILLGLLVFVRPAPTH